MTISPEEAKFDRRQKLAKKEESSMPCAQVCQLQATNESHKIDPEGICSIKDVCVDIIHSFEGQMADDESLESESQNTNFDFVRANWRELGRNYP